MTHAGMAEAHLKAVVDTALDGIITLNESFRIVLFNRAAESIFGCQAREVLGEPLDRFIPSVHRANHEQFITRFAHKRKASHGIGVNDRIVTGIRFNGEEFPIDTAISHVKVDGAQFYTVILRDVSEREQTARELADTVGQLRELSVRMHLVREDERRHLAHELHDDLCQLLAALRIDLSVLKSRWPLPNEEIVAQFQRLETISREAVETSRRVTRSLRPTALEDSTLSAAIEELCLEFSRRTGIPCQFKRTGPSEPQEERLATPLFRLVQESLTNIEKHAQASEVTVTLQRDANNLRLLVQDNGRGMPSAMKPRENAFGLVGMRERTLAAGGKFSVDSTQGVGTRVLAEFPLMAPLGTSDFAGTRQSSSCDGKQGV